MLCLSLLDDTYEEVGRKGRWPGEMGKGSRTLRRLVIHAGHFEPRLAKDSSWTRRRSIVLFGAFSEIGEVRKNAGTLRNLWRLFGRAPSSSRFLSFARSGMSLEGRSEKTLGHWSLAPGDASKVGRSGRLNVLRWAIAPRFCEDSSMACRNVPSLPPECSVRGGEA